MINRYWTTVKTLAEMERDCKERQLNSAWMEDFHEACTCCKTRPIQCM